MALAARNGAATALPDSNPVDLCGIAPSLNVPIVASALRIASATQRSSKWTLALGADGPRCIGLKGANGAEVGRLNFLVLDFGRVLGTLIDEMSSFATFVSEVFRPQDLP